VNIFARQAFEKQKPLNDEIIGYTGNMLRVRVGATFGMIKHDKQKGVDGQENHLGSL
jgi:hypothetical protein